MRVRKVRERTTSNYNWSQWVRHILLTAACLSIQGDDGVRVRSAQLYMWCSWPDILQCGEDQDGQEWGLLQSVRVFPPPQDGAGAEDGKLQAERSSQQNVPDGWEGARHSQGGVLTSLCSQTWPGRWRCCYHTSAQEHRHGLHWEPRPRLPGRHETPRTVRQDCRAGEHRGGQEREAALPGGGAGVPRHGLRADGAGGEEAGQPDRPHGVHLTLQRPGGHRRPGHTGSRDPGAAAQSPLSLHLCGRRRPHSRGGGLREDREARGGDSGLSTCGLPRDERECGGGPDSGVAQHGDFVWRHSRGGGDRSCHLPSLCHAGGRLAGRGRRRH